MTLNDFDNIWCLHCVEDLDRYENTLKQFSKVSILEKIQYSIASKYPDVGLKNNTINGVPKYTQIKSDALYHCTREHYNMINISYNKGHNHILIFEDDCQIINKNYFDILMNNIPDDFDIILYKYMFINSPNNISIMKENYEKFKNGIYYILTNNCYWFTGSYALSRRGMEYYMNYVKEHKFGCVADLPFGSRDFKDTNLKFYISSIPLLYDDNFPSTLNNTKYDVSQIYENAGLTKEMYYEE